ncbi:hypothetical protein VNO78_33340 [Psophocarpus tetragonolobus]|uniref:Uncharacterized protein n=1 Tax=Psophocarpus tetragonolobus TaxID=3891 RepID=A0AAN9NX81_PSOTE
MPLLLALNVLQVTLLCQNNCIMNDYEMLIKEAQSYAQGNPLGLEIMSMSRKCYIIMDWIPKVAYKICPQISYNSSWLYVYMHGLLRELGRSIVPEESLEEPNKWSRIWDGKDFRKVIFPKYCKDIIDGIEAIIVDVGYESDHDVGYQSDDGELHESIIKPLYSLTYLYVSGSKDLIKLPDFEMPKALGRLTCKAANAKKKGQLKTSLFLEIEEHNIAKTLIHQVSEDGSVDGRSNIQKYLASNCMCFDVESECIKMYPMPLNIQNHDVKYFGESCGHLHMILQSPDPFSFDILELEEDYSGWALRFGLILDLCK